MANRNTAREGEQIDRKFKQLYNPLTPVFEGLSFDIKTGKIIVPEDVKNEVNQVNRDWNYVATIMNRKCKGATANFGAIQTKFNKDVSSKEMKLFLQVTAKVFEDKYKLSPDKLEVDFILKYKSEGLSPEEVCDVRVLEMEPDKVHLWKHKHNWIIVKSDVLFYIICKGCRYKHYALFSEKENSEAVIDKLPKTRLGLWINYFKNYNK